jgi:hypothetical protein
LIAAILDNPFVGGHLFGDFVFDQLVYRAHLSGTTGLPNGSRFAVALPAVLAVSALFALGGVRQATGIRLAHFATFFAVAGNANIFLAAAVTSDFDVFHFANDVANFLTMRGTATVVTAAIAAIVGRGNQRAQD